MSACGCEGPANGNDLFIGIERMGDQLFHVPQALAHVDCGQDLPALGDSEPVCDFEMP